MPDRDGEALERLTAVAARSPFTIAITPPVTALFRVGFLNFINNIRSGLGPFLAQPMLGCYRHDEYSIQSRFQPARYRVRP